MLSRSVVSRVIRFLRFSVQGLLAGILVVTCMANCSAEECLKVKANDVRKQLILEIKPGDAREEAEIALRSVGASFSYDEFQNRLGAIIRDVGCGPYESIEIDVNLNGYGRVSSVKVSESYTYP